MPCVIENAFGLWHYGSEHAIPHLSLEACSTSGAYRMFSGQSSSSLFKVFGAGLARTALEVLSPEASTGMLVGVQMSKSVRSWRGTR